MTDLPPRLFATDADVIRIGEGLLACTLPRADWTHEAHLAACLYLLRERPEIDLEARIAGIISSFNESVGGVNDDQGGYHDTITRCYLAGVRQFLTRRSRGEPLVEAVNALLASPTGRRDWPLRFYSRERLFSVPARRGFLTPDLQPFETQP